MHSYTVADVNPSVRLVALRDLNGRYHAAHCTSNLPAVGDVLSGSLPARGFSLLIDSDGGVCRMTFSQVNCGQRWVMGMLHPDQTQMVSARTVVVPIVEGGRLS